MIIISDKMKCTPTECKFCKHGIDVMKMVQGKQREKYHPRECFYRWDYIEPVKYGQPFKFKQLGFNLKITPQDMDKILSVTWILSLSLDERENLRKAVLTRIHNNHQKL